MLDFLIGNDFLSALIAFAVVLIPAVIIHELGHFLAAKAVGITVLEFGIGFPPRVAKLFTWGETEFTLNLLPLGGFVRPLGEDFVRPLSEEETEQAREDLISSRQDIHKNDTNDIEDGAFVTEREELAARGIHNTKSVNEASPMGRILFMSAGALANFLSAFAIFVFAGSLGVPEIVGARLGVTQISLNAVFSEAGMQGGDIIEQINGEYFTSDTDFIARLSELTEQQVVITVFRSELDESITLEPITLSTEDIEQLTAPRAGVMVVGVSANTPADGNLFAGDLIVGVNGEFLDELGDPISILQDETLSFAGQDLVLNVIQDNEIVDVVLSPQANPPPGVGRVGISIREGFAGGDNDFVYIEPLPLFETVSKNVGESIDYGIDRIAEIFQLIAEFPSRLVQGTTEPGENRLVSIVGVSQLGSRFLQDSIEENEPVVFIEYIALISIALGFTNLLPIPALDGGRILFVLIEILRGKPISPEREGIIHFVGLIFLLSIGVIFIFNDILNPVTNLLP